MCGNRWVGPAGTPKYSTPCLLWTFLDWWGNPIWSSLIYFEQIWSKKIKNEMANLILYKNVTTFYINIFWHVKLLRSLINSDQVWSILDRSDPKKIKNKTAIFIHSVNMTAFYSNVFSFLMAEKSNLIQFDPVWSKKIQNEMAIFIILNMWQLIILTFFDMCNH